MTRLQDRRDGHLRDQERLTLELEEVKERLRRAPKVTEALDTLQGELFRTLTAVLEEKLTIALQEVLEQPIAFKAKAEIRRNQIEIDFSIERGGQPEDIMKGQGGSVANVLSVGLRIFALTTLDPKDHRRFLLLDEQDCWLRPDLVPRLVKIIHDAGEALGFQVILISHHDVEPLRGFADKVYTFKPDQGEGVEVVHRDDISLADGVG
jgi:ABC-type glutathione transport system ATPase component